jgi:ribosomal protein S18 acetylase RimI-like enzyme
MQIRDMSDGPVDAIVAVDRLFDGPAQPAAAARFAELHGHHLLVAFEEHVPAGFVTGVEMTHPDKGTEMFLNELGVDEQFRGRGIATALVSALADRARDRGCYGMWVLTDIDNAAARRAYQAAGAGDPDAEVMLSWTFDG